MMIHLAPNHWQVLLCIIRKTYGYHKKVDNIANSQIVQATGLCKAVVSRTLRNLSDMNVIDRNGKYTSLQKDWERWPKLAEQSTNEKLAILPKELAISSTKVSSPAVTQKKKETIQKKILRGQNLFLPPEVPVIFSEMKSYLGYPDKTDKDPIPNYGKEGQSIKRMLTRGFTREEILALWKAKVSQCGGDFVSMTWVNEDIGKKGGTGRLQARGKIPPKQLPTTADLKESWEKGKQ